MGHTCNLGGGCILTTIGIFVLWWLLASALLWQTWNQVILVFFKVKPARFSQALLLIATLCSFAAPCWYMHAKESSHCAHMRCHHSGEAMESAGGSKGDCPYSRKSGLSENESTPEADSPKKSQ